MFPGVVPQLKGHFVLLHQGGVALQTSLFHELYSLFSTPDHSFHQVLAKAKYLPFFQAQLGRYLLFKERAGTHQLSNVNLSRLSSVLRLMSRQLPEPQPQCITPTKFGKWKQVNHWSLGVSYTQRIKRNTEGHVPKKAHLFSCNMDSGNSCHFLLAHAYTSLCYGREIRHEPFSS